MRKAIKLKGTELSVRVSQRLRRLREARKWPQHEVAKKLGLSVQQYGAYERYARHPQFNSILSLDRLADIARAMGVPVKYFIADGEARLPTLDDEAARLYKHLSAQDKKRVVKIMELFSRRR